MTSAAIFIFHWAGYFHDFLHCVVKLLGDIRIGNLVIHLFALTAGHNQTTGFQDPEMVRYSRARHTGHGCDIDDALLYMAEDPKDAKSARIVQLFHQFGYSLKVIIRRHTLHYFA